MTAAPDASPLAVEDLHFGYEPQAPVVRGLSGRLEAGQICALIGPNAVGKTTLLRLMLGQLVPQRGAVRLAGEAVTALAPRRRAELASYVPQRAGVSFAFTVEQVVAMGRFARPADPGAIETALRLCDLLEIRGRVFAQLSMGQQQRVLLARAVTQAAGHGRVMLLDEPGSAMDLWHVHQMMEMLGQLARRGLAILVVLHDLNLAARYAEQVWLMHQGRLMASGSWRDVLVPERLEPIYRVRLRPIVAPGHERPAFLVEGRAEA